MRVISHQIIKEFILTHPDAEPGLNAWYQAIRLHPYASFHELKQTFGSVDKVSKGFIFNIGGNKYRLAVSIHFNTQLVYIREIMTHAEYSNNSWKKRHQDFA